MPTDDSADNAEEVEEVRTVVDSAHCKASHCN